MRHLSLFLVLLLVSCSRGAISPDVAQHSAAPEPDPAKYDEIVVVGTNDFHGYLRPNENEVAGAKVISGGIEWFGGYARILEKKFGDRLVLLDGGDMFQGTLDSNFFFGQPVVAAYNQLPYRAVALGNHEFDYGPANSKNKKDYLAALRARMREARYPFVQANIFLKKTGRHWREKNLSPSVLVRAGAYRVGIIGLTTTHTPATTLPKHVASLEFRDFVAPTIAEAKKLRAAGADLVLVTTHEGDGSPGDPLEKFLGALPPGTLDAVVAGHTHTERHDFVHGVPVIESKTRGLFFGRIDLFVNKGTKRVEPSLTRIHGMQPICGTWFRSSETCDFKEAKDALAAGKEKPADLLPLRAPTYEGEAVKADPAVHAAVAPFLEKSDARRREVLGQAQVDFSYCPSGESQMGTLLLDAFHARFPQARVVFLNGGGIRRRLFKGPITYGDVFEVSPFDNNAVLVRVSGKELKEIVKVLVSGAHVPPMISGVTVNFFDRDDPAFDRDVNGDGKKEKWERDRLDPKNGLVWISTGKPVRDDEEFWMATIDYLTTGGDNEMVAFGAIPESRKQYYAIAPRDLVADYLRKHPGLNLPRAEPMHLHAEGANHQVLEH